jgi:alkaline phosphatase
MKTTIYALALLAATTTCACAQAIYPVNRAHILSGAAFDLKIEFPGSPPPESLKVTINGKDAAAVLNAAPEIVAHEEGQDQVAYWIRGAHISDPGKYVIEADAGGAKSSVEWTVFATPDPPKAKNVILFIGDGMSIAHRTAARILSKGLVEGRYGGELEMDDMPYMALVSTSGTDSVVTDSANAMTAFTTGHKSCVNALGVYCANNKSTLKHPSVETIASLVKRKRGMAVGIITNTEIEDATPAGVVAHTRRRADYDDIVRMLYEARPEVLMGGGTPNFLPKSDARGKRADEDNYLEKFKQAGYAFVDTAKGLAAASAKPDTTKLLGLFNDRNIDGVLDRKFLKKGSVAEYPDQPDLTEELSAALQILSRNDKGFFLMCESGRIDKYSHSLDWERAVYDTIMLDNAVKIAKDFAAKHGDTLIVVVPDHGHPVSIIGTYDDAAGATLRERLQTYAEAKFPNYAPPDADGYPPSIDVSRRLALVFSAYPDYCDAGKPYLNGENTPTAPAADGKTFVANEVYCAPGSARRIGNLSIFAKQGVHSADDVLLTASGPGAELFHGHLDNTDVFRVMATALALGR